MIGSVPQGPPESKPSYIRDARTEALLNTLDNVKVCGEQTRAARRLPYSYADLAYTSRDVTDVAQQDPMRGGLPQKLRLAKQWTSLDSGTAVLIAERCSDYDTRYLCPEGFCSHAWMLPLETDQTFCPLQARQKQRWS